MQKCTGSRLTSFFHIKFYEPFPTLQTKNIFFSGVLLMEFTVPLYLEQCTCWTVHIFVRGPMLLLKELLLLPS